MGASGNVLAFKTPYAALEHCKEELANWHAQWQAALKSSEREQLRALVERYRHRVLAVYPKDQYRGSWAGASAGFAYRLYEFSEFERPLENMMEARSLHTQALSDYNPSFKVVYGPALHRQAQILLRLAELDGDMTCLQQAERLCIQAAGVYGSEERRYLSTMGAVLRRIAEQRRDVAACDAALAVLQRADIEQDPTNGDLSWALQRQSVAGVLLLKRQLGSTEVDFTSAKRAVEDALANYSINPHGFWIRPSTLADAINTKAQIEKLS